MAEVHNDVFNVAPKFHCLTVSNHIVLGFCNQAAALSTTTRKCSSSMHAASIIDAHDWLVQDETLQLMLPPVPAIIRRAVECRAGPTAPAALEFQMAEPLRRL